MTMILKLIGMFAVIVVSPVSGVQLTFTRNRVIMGAPGETVMTCAVDESDISEIFNIQVSVYSRTFPTGKPIAMVKRDGLDDATTANLGDLANRVTITGSIATNLRESRITVFFDTERIQCADAAYYECSVSYLNNAQKPVTISNSVNTSLEVYEYPVMGKLVVRHNGIEINKGTSSRNPAFKVGDQIELSCSANVGSINTTLIQWRRTSEIGREDIWNEYQPSAAASSDGEAVRENCGYLRTATMLYNMTIADANRQNNLGFECYVRVSDHIYNNYMTPEAMNPKFYADVSVDNGGNAQHHASSGIYIYIGGPVGGGIAAAIILTVVILLFCRRRIRKENGEPPSVLNETTANYTDLQTSQLEYANKTSDYTELSTRPGNGEPHSVLHETTANYTDLQTSQHDYANKTSDYSELNTRPEKAFESRTANYTGLQTSQHQYANKTSDYSELNTRPGNGEAPSVLNDSTANYTDLQTSQHQYANKTSDYSKLNNRPGNGEKHSVLNETTAHYTDLQTSQHDYANKTSDYSELQTRPGEMAFESRFHKTGYIRRCFT